jgi:hypothetical protein
MVEEATVTEYGVIREDRGKVSGGMEFGVLRGGSRKWEKSGVRKLAGNFKLGPPSMFSPT